MKVSRIVATLLLSFLLVSVFACTSGGESKPTPTPTATHTPIPTSTPISTSMPTTVATATPAACGWSGTWDTEWGIMVLVQTGDHVVGNYTYQGGYIEGIVSGNKMTGTWSELPTYFPPDDGGTVVLTISDNCHSITGQWRYGFTGGWNGSWTGTWVNSSTTTPIPTSVPTVTPTVTPTPTPTATATPTPVPTATPTPVSCSWNGTWDSDWDTMVLVQTENNITGTYGYQGGRITGTVSGNKLTGTWSEAPSYSPPDDAGTVELTMSTNCSLFSGRWSYGSGGWAGTWSGTKAY